MTPKDREALEAAAQIKAVHIFAATEEADINFLLGQLGLGFGSVAERNIVRSFRRQMIIASASETTIDRIAPPAAEGAVRDAWARAIVDRRYPWATNTEQMFERYHSEDHSNLDGRHRTAIGDAYRDVDAILSLRSPSGSAVAMREKALRDEIWCLRQIVGDVRLLHTAGSFKEFEGEPWLKRINNIDLHYDPCAALAAPQPQELAVSRPRRGDSK